MVAETLGEEGDLLIRLDAKVLEGELAAIEGQLLEILARRACLEAKEARMNRLTFNPMLLEFQNPIAAEAVELPLLPEPVPRKGDL